MIATCKKGGFARRSCAWKPSKFLGIFGGSVAPHKAPKWVSVAAGLATGTLTLQNSGVATPEKMGTKAATCVSKQVCSPAAPLDTGFSSPAP